MNVKIKDIFHILLFAILIIVIYFESITNAQLRDLLVILGLGLVMLYCLIIKGNISFIKGTGIWAILLLIILFSLSSLYDIDSYVIHFAFGISLFLLCSLSQFEVEKIVKVMVFFGKFYAFWTLVQYILPSLYAQYVKPLLLNNKELYLSVDNSVVYMNGLTKQVAINSIYIVMGLIGIIIGKVKKYSIQDLMWIVIELCALLLTGKRMAIVFLVIALFFSMNIGITVSKKVKNIIKYVIIGIVVIIFCLIAIPELRYFFERLLEVGDDINSYSSGRISLYKKAWEYFLEEPLTGNGWFYYVDNISVYWGKKIYVHNVYLQLLCEVGIIGTIFFVYAMFTMLKKAIDRLKKAEIMFEKKLLRISIAIQVFYLLYCFTGNPLYDKYNLLMYILSIHMSKFVIVNKKKARIIKEEKNECFTINKITT